MRATDGGTCHSAARAAESKREAHRENASAASLIAVSLPLVVALSLPSLSAVVDVMQLPVADLQKLRQSLTEDVQTITQNYGNLKVRSSKHRPSSSTTDTGEATHAQTNQT